MVNVGHPELVMLYNPYVIDYDSDELDEDSFHNALNAIHNMERGIGSTSRILLTHTPPPSSQNQEQQGLQD